ncbi:hypothetical protein WA577_005153, partial [Blastocystis sp. JDR]
ITDLLWYCLFWKGDEQSDGARIKQLLKSIDPKLSLTPDAEKMIILMANDFILDVTKGSTRIAECRQSKNVELLDLAVYLKKNWDIDVDGYSITTTNSDNYVL